MISLEKREIAKYLRDYAMLAEQMRYNPTTSMYTVFAINMLASGRYDDCNQEYFDKMLRVYSFYTELKIFSFYEDLQMDYINENDLLFDDIKNAIFVNPQDSKCFSKKQVIRYIRNAFNHSDGEKELYSISVNGRFLSISLKDTEPKPFNIKLDIIQLNEIRKCLVASGRNLLLAGFEIDPSFDISSQDLYFELDKIKYKHYYFNKKITPDTLRKIGEILSTKINKEEELSEKINSIDEAIKNEKNFVRYFDLMPEQKEKIYDSFKVIRGLHKQGKFEALGDDYLRFCMHSILNKTVPLGMYHTEQITYELIFAMWYAREGNMSLAHAKEEIKKVYTTYGESDKSQVENKNFSEFRYDMMLGIYNDRNEKERLRVIDSDTESQIIYPLMMYLGFLLDNLCDQETIVIGKKSYEKEKLRNSIVHGRWFIGKGRIIHFYDCPIGNSNDYNFDFHEAISAYDLKEWGENYFNNGFDDVKAK